MSPDDDDYEVRRASEDDEQEPCEFCGQPVGTSMHGNVCNNCAEENYDDGSGDL